MAANLGKSGTLVEASDQRSGEPTSQKRGEPTSQKRDVGHPQVAISNSDPAGAASEKTISVEASAAEAFAGPIAPESCFSTKPAARSLTDIRREVFRTSALHPAGQRTLNRYFAPLPER